jgi:hypothetical protein
MEKIFALFLLIFAASLGALVLWKLFDITRNSIKKSKASYDEERFDKLAKAFIQHRKDTDKRFQNIETILTETQASPTADANQQIDTLLGTIGNDAEASEVRQNQRISDEKNGSKIHSNSKKRTS